MAVFPVTVERVEFAFVWLDVHHLRPPAEVAHPVLVTAAKIS